MAKYTVAQVSEKLLRVRELLHTGKSTAEACKAVGLSTGTYKRWLETYRDLDVPSWVIPAPVRGAIAISGDARSVFTAGDGPDGYVLARYDATTGAETARATIAAQAGGPTWREVLTLGVDASGERALALASGGAMYAWDVARGEATPCARDLRDRATNLTGRASSGPRRWAYAAFSPDLSRVAYWEQTGDAATKEPARLCVRRLDDDAVVMRHELSPLFIPPPIVFHPTRPLLALYDENKLTVLLDLDQARAVIERGPQVHALSFSTGDTMLYDDWYGHTQELDVTSGASRVLGRGWGSLGSQRDRYVTASEQLVVVRSKRDPAATRTIAFEKIQEYLLSRDATRLVIVTDAVCGWDLGPSEP